MITVFIYSKSNRKVSKEKETAETMIGNRTYDYSNITAKRCKKTFVKDEFCFVSLFQSESRIFLKIQYVPMTICIYAKKLEKSYISIERRMCSAEESSSDKRL